MTNNRTKNPKNRTKNQIIYGLHAVRAALMNDKREHDELYINENHHKIGKSYQSKIKKIYYLSQKEFKKLYVNEKSTQGIVLKTKDFEKPTLDQFLKSENLNSKSIILALDQIQTLKI